MKSLASRGHMFIGPKNKASTKLSLSMDAIQWAFVRAVLDKWIQEHMSEVEGLGDNDIATQEHHLVTHASLQIFRILDPKGYEKCQAEYEKGLPGLPK